MDFGGGMAVGMSAGIGSGIAIGVGVGEQESTKRIRKYLQENNLRVFDEEGNEVDVDEILVKTSRRCESGVATTRVKSFALIALLAGAIILGIVAYAVFN